MALEPQAAPSAQASWEGMPAELRAALRDPRLEPPWSWEALGLALGRLAAQKASRAGPPAARLPEQVAEWCANPAGRAAAELAAAAAAGLLAGDGGGTAADDRLAWAALLETLAAGAPSALHPHAERLCEVLEREAGARERWTSHLCRALAGALPGADGGALDAAAGLRAALESVLEEPPTLGALVDLEVLWRAHSVAECWCAVSLRTAGGGAAVRARAVQLERAVACAVERAAGASVPEIAALCHQVWTLSTIVCGLNPSAPAPGEKSDAGTATPGSSPGMRSDQEAADSVADSAADSLAALCRSGPEVLRPALLPCVAILLRGAGHGLAEETVARLCNTLAAGMSDEGRLVRARAVGALAWLLRYPEEGRSGPEGAPRLALPAPMLERLSLFQAFALRSMLAARSPSAASEAWAVFRALRQAGGSCVSAVPELLAACLAGAPLAAASCRARLARELLASPTWPAAEVARGARLALETRALRGEADPEAPDPLDERALQRVPELAGAVAEEARALPLERVSQAVCGMLGTLQRLAAGPAGGGECAAEVEAAAVLVPLCLGLLPGLLAVRGGDARLEAAEAASSALSSAPAPRGRLEVPQPAARAALAALALLRRHCGSQAAGGGGPADGGAAAGAALLPQLEELLEGAALEAGAEPSAAEAAMLPQLEELLEGAAAEAGADVVDGPGGDDDDVEAAQLPGVAAGPVVGAPPPAEAPAEAAAASAGAAGAVAQPAAPGPAHADVAAPGPAEDAGGPEAAAAAPEPAAAGAPELPAEEPAVAEAAAAPEGVPADCAAFTPEVVSRELCMARTWAGGRGGQCQKQPRGASCLCPGHRAGCSHGRVDGPIPAAKLALFLRSAAKLAAGPAAAAQPAAGAPAEGRPRRRPSRLAESARLAESVIPSGGRRRAPPAAGAPAEARRKEARPEAARGLAKLGPGLARARARTLRAARAGAPKRRLAAPTAAGRAAASARAAGAARVCAGRKRPLRQGPGEGADGARGAAGPAGARAERRSASQGPEGRCDGAGKPVGAANQRARRVAIGGC